MTSNHEKPDNADNAAINPESGWFGYKAVSASQKTQKVFDVFDSVATNYDRMNDFMSFGMHRLWKDRLIRQIRPRASDRCLDVAGGTGDIAFRLKKATQGRAHVTICDLTAPMLQVGRDRAADRNIVSGIEWVCGNAEVLPFEDNSFDIYTIAFGLRNVTRIDTALEEAKRVLKPGGRFFCMEFSHVNDRALRQLYDIYSFKIIPKMGEIVAKDRDSYQYLAESIRQFPKPEALCTRLKAAGFGRATFTPMTFGVVAVHEAWKV